VHDDTAVPCTICCGLNGWINVRTPRPAAGIAEELQFRRRSVEVDAIGTNAEGIAGGVREQVTVDVADDRGSRAGDDLGEAGRRELDQAGECKRRFTGERNAAEGVRSVALMK